MLQHRDFPGHWLAIHDAKFEPLSAKVGCISHMHQCTSVHNMICSSRVVLISNLCIKTTAKPFSH